MRQDLVNLVRFITVLFQLTDAAYILSNKDFESFRISSNIIPNIPDNDEDFIQEGSQIVNSCTMIDMSSCTEDCLLGYETNDKGCVVSCDCKQEGLFEGDITVQKQDLPYFNDLYGLAKTKGASTVKPGRLRWDNQPNGDGTYIVPYVLHPSLNGKPVVQNLLISAFSDFEKFTCIRLKPRREENDYLEFKIGEGCSSPVGRSKGSHPVTLAFNCLKKGSFIHEIMHSLGFYHEQSRPDRDQFVKVIHANVMPAFMSQIRKMTSGDINSLGSPYDITSVLHYGGAFFSKNGKPTIINLKTGTPVKAQRQGFSDEDIKQINAMYNCKR